MAEHTDPAFQAHVADIATQRADLRESLRDIHQQLSSILIDLKALRAAGCGGDCCLGFWQHQHANAFIQEADRAAFAARALIALEA